MSEREPSGTREQTEHDEHTPRRAEEQGESVPERPVRPDEETGESVEQMDDPPQAEGDRDE